jgi:glycosyltransferase involved in cell wall biosynthesis
VHRTLGWYWSYERYEFPRLGPLERARLERRNAAELQRHLREFRPDVVAWWAMGCMSLSLIEQVRRAGLPAVFLVHDNWLVYGWKFDAWTRIWKRWRKPFAPIAELVCRVPTQVHVSRAGPMVFNSRYTLEQAAAAGFASPHATVVHPGIDERFLDRIPPKQWEWRILYVGRIDRQKGVDTALRALAELPPEATLTIHGTGDPEYLSEMRAEAERMRVADRVDFGRFASQGELRAIYAAADVVVFPVRWEEPFGLIPLEAMGLGRPVVATAHGGSAEFLRDGDNALTFAADDHGELAERVRRLAGDPDLRARLVEHGARTAAAHTADEFARRTVEAIVAAAGLRHPRSRRNA